MFYYKSKNYTIKLEALLLIQKLNLNFSRLKLMAIVTVLVKKFFLKSERNTSHFTSI